MRNLVPIFAVFLAIPIVLVTQNLSPRESALQLHDMQHVSGVVRDSSGTPVADTSIQHLGRSAREASTDLSGHFEFSTRVPAFVISKMGYESALVRTENAHHIQVTLKRNESTLPTCSSKSLCMSVESVGFAFCFASVKGVKVSDPATDVDYGYRIYSVKSGHGRKIMQQAGGSTWGEGLPYDEDVWTSVEYSQKTYAFGVRYVVDARGKTAAGKFWRSIGRFGETAAYSDADQESAALFDKVLDSVCIKEGPQR